MTILYYTIEGNYLSVTLDPKDKSVISYSDFKTEYDKLVLISQEKLTRTIYKLEIDCWDQYLE